KAADIEFQELLAKAVALRLRKTPYDVIIEKLGHWNSISACQKAVAGYLKKNQTKIVEDSRAESVAILEGIIFDLLDKFDKNKSILTAREIRNQLREVNLLQGNYAPTKIAETDADGNDKPKVVVYLPDNGRDTNQPK
ncbi:MAG TPA: hypothetical protein VF692_07665, partial [Pyrinomonadaceae bacterium]